MNHALAFEGRPLISQIQRDRGAQGFTRATPVANSVNLESRSLTSLPWRASKVR